MEEMDKLLEDLQKINVEFNNQLSKYEALIYQTGRTNEKLEKYTDSNRDKVDRLCIRVENKLGEINKQIEEISEECKGVFTQYSTEIASLNEEERSAFSNMLMGKLNQYKKEFLRDVLGDYQKILQAFMENIKREADSVVSGQRDISALVKTTEETNADLVKQVQGLRVVVNGCLDAINHTISGINDSYMVIFGEFSKQVNAVNKDDRKRFIGELSRELDRYKTEFGIYGTILEENKKINQELSELTLQNTENVQAMEKQLKQRLNQTQEVLDHISNAYEKGFDSFAKDVSVLNSRERENLVVAVRSMIEDYRFTFGKEIESKGKEMNTLFQNTLVGVCNTFGTKYKEYQRLLDNTKSSNEELHDSLQRTLLEIEGLAMSLMRREDMIKDALAYMKDDYRGTISRYVQEIEQSNVRARELLAQTAAQSVSGMTERFLHQLELFKNERSTYMQQMEQLLEEERKDRESMLNRQAEVINLLKMEQEASKRQLEEKQKEINRYQMVMSTVSVVLLIICILLLIPWTNGTFWAFVGLPVVITLGLVVTIFRKRIVKWIKKKLNQRSTHILFFLLMCLGLTGCQKQEVINKEVDIQDQVVREVNYELTQVSRGKVEQVMYLQCTYTQTEEVELGFEIDQELITSVYVEKGDSVVKGEVLASVDVEATEEKLRELEHELAKNELKLKQTIERRDFELEQADILYTYTSMKQQDKENTEKEKQSITEAYVKTIQDYEDTIFFQKKRIQEYVDYIDKGQLLAPMDGVVSWVKGDLEGSWTEKDTPIVRIFDPESKMYYSDDVEAIPYLQEGEEYSIACGLGKTQKIYTVTPIKMDEWGEFIYFDLLDEDYDPNNVVAGEITLVIEEKEDALYVNNDAVHSSKEEYYVYTLDENNVRRMQFVEVGLWGDENVEIISGLTEDDRVILK